MKEQDYIKELGYLGFATRLKRISDVMMHSGRDLYNSLNMDIEPNWYVIFKIIQSRGGMSVTEIADAIRMSHPSVIAITNKMINKGYLNSVKDASDSRKRQLDLSDYTYKRLPEFELIWQAGIDGLEKALKNLKALEFVEQLEVVFDQQSFKDRTIEALNEKNDNII